MMAANVPAPPAPVAQPQANILAAVVVAPINSSMPVILDQASILVQGTACLRWVLVGAAAGAPARVQLPQFIMVAVFFIRVTLDTSPASMATFSLVHVLNVACTGAFWSRILTEYVASGLLAQPITDVASLVTALAGLTISNPANMVLQPNDLALGEAFDLPGAPGIPGQRAHGRRGQAGYRPPVAAVPPGPPTPGPSNLEYLTHLTIARAVNPLLASTPLRAFAKLKLLVGDCLTSQSRIDRTTLVHITTNVLRKKFGKAGLWRCWQRRRPLSRNATSGLPAWTAPPAALASCVTRRKLHPARSHRQYPLHVWWC